MKWVYVGLLLIACFGAGYLVRGQSCEREKASIAIDNLRAGVKASSEAIEDREQIEIRTKSWDENRIDAELVGNEWMRNSSTN